LPAPRPQSSRGHACLRFPPVRPSSSCTYASPDD